MSKQVNDNSSRSNMTGKQIRQANFEQTQQEVEVTAEEVRESFRQYFATLKRKLNLSKDLEQIIWNHMVQCGFDQTSMFDDGVKHFGYDV